MRSLLSFFVLFLFAISVNASGSIPNFDAHYKAYKSGIKAATAHVSFKNSNNQFVYKSVAEVAGVVSLFRSDIITKISKGTFDNNHFKVNSYSYTHMKGKKRKKYRAINFDWDKKQAYNEFKHNKVTVNLKKGAIDKFTLELAVMNDLQNNKKSLDYTIVDDGKLKFYHFSIIGKETIKTSAGKFETIKIKRVRNKKKRTTFMWCAPKLRYLPVKIVHSEDGSKKFSLELAKIKGL